MGGVFSSRQETLDKLLPSVSYTTSRPDGEGGICVVVTHCVAVHVWGGICTRTLYMLCTT